MINRLLEIAWWPLIIVTVILAIVQNNLFLAVTAVFCVLIRVALWI